MSLGWGRTNTIEQRAGIDNILEKHNNYPQVLGRVPESAVLNTRALELLWQSAATSDAII
jgi:hypothetical protein